MPVFPNLIERQLVRPNTFPRSIYDVFGGGALRVADVALRLGVFETLSNGPLSATDLAKQDNLDARGTTILLEALEAFGHVKKQNGLYSNTRMTNKWLVSKSPTCLADWAIPMQKLQLEFWDTCLEEAVRHGKPPISIY